MTPDQREEIEDAAAKFEASRDCGDVLELLRLTLQYCAAPFEVRAVVQAATERWHSGRADPSDESSAPVRGLDGAFQTRMRPGRWKPATADLRVHSAEAGCAVPFDFQAWKLVDALRAAGWPADRRKKRNAFAEAARLLSIDGRIPAPIVIERAYRRVAKLAARQQPALPQEPGDTRGKPLR